MSRYPAGTKLRADEGHRILRPLRNCVLSKIEVERHSGADESIDVDPPFYLETGLAYSVFVPAKGDPELCEVEPDEDQWAGAGLQSDSGAVGMRATRH